ncbi:MAG: SDR family oxidoreductase [Clostridiales bacterium]|nr:SDR family oxidoreductase [Clostridiales bacterium]MDY5515173.1 SDR family oxidoreductase [Candidatus Ventricola sp.]
MAYQYDIPFHVDLNGRVALVTGGNGGIGGMFCRALAACGAKVIVLGRNLERCQKVVDEIVAGGGEADAISADVTDEAAMLRVKEEVERKYGKLNILINAAGGNVRSATVPQEQMADGGETTFFDVPASEIQKELDLNLRGTWMPSKILTPLMLGQQGACVINISSMSAFGPLTKIPGYSAAKAGVSNFTQWLATYLARSGVRVNAIAPGFFATEQNHALQFNPDGTPTPRRQKIINGTPMGRYGELNELIGAMLFLVDERAAGFVTGIVLPVDGGYSAYSGV